MNIKLNIKASRPNGFELLYCENGSAHHNGPVNMRTPFKKNVYPAQELVPADITKKILALEKGPEPIQNQVVFIYVTGMTI